MAKGTCLIFKVIAKFTARKIININLVGMHAQIGYHGNLNYERSFFMSARMDTFLCVHGKTSYTTNSVHFQPVHCCLLTKAIGPGKNTFVIVA